ncbi:MAG: flavodoxin [Eubacterium sp.]|jgi:menaquinone-dependent protoporphyrinogen IX oxidase|nr:flavodoxin [Eubacterium sp.]
MGKGIVLYQSKYGSTKKYAQWLGEKMRYDCIETKKADIKKLKQFDTIILGGGVYASGILGLSFLKKNIESLCNKKIAVFCVGASPYDENAINQIRNLHFKDKLSNIPLFYCRGAWNEENMSFKERTLCKMLQKVVAKQDPDTYEPWQKALMCAVGQKCDWTDREYLKPIIEFIKEN